MRLNLVFLLVLACILLYTPDEGRRQKLSNYVETLVTTGNWAQPTRLVRTTMGKRVMDAVQCPMVACRNSHCSIDAFKVEENDDDHGYYCGNGGDVGGVDCGGWMEVKQRPEFTRWRRKRADARGRQPCDSCRRWPA